MSETTNGSSVGFTGLLTILFVGLKLTGVIAWSWWWVLSPLWISVAFAALLFGGVFVFCYLREFRKGS